MTNENSTPISSTARNGFLPIDTNWFDRVFISVMLFVAIHLVWMRWFEPQDLPLTIATVISLIVAAIIIRWG